MEQMTGKKIRELFLKAPDAIKEAIESDETSRVILEIGKKHGLPIDKIGDLSYTATLMMVGVIPAHSFIAELKTSLNIPESQVNEIAKEINARIFAPIREELKRVHGESAHDPLISETPRITPKIDLTKNAALPAGGALLTSIPRSIPVNGSQKQAPVPAVAPKPASPAPSPAPQALRSASANATPKPQLLQTNFWNTVNNDLKSVPVTAPAKVEIAQSVAPAPKPPVSVPVKAATSVKLNAVEEKPASAVISAPIKNAGAANLAPAESAKRSNLHEEVHRLLAEHFESTAAVPSQSQPKPVSQMDEKAPSAPLRETPAPKAPPVAAVKEPAVAAKPPVTSYRDKDPYREPVDDHHNF